MNELQKTDLICKLCTKNYKGYTWVTYCEDCMYKTEWRNASKHPFQHIDFIKFSLMETVDSVFN